MDLYQGDVGCFYCVVGGVDVCCYVSGFDDFCCLLLFDYVEIVDCWQYVGVNVGQYQVVYQYFFGVCGVGGDCLLYGVDVVVEYQQEFFGVKGFVEQELYVCVFQYDVVQFYFSGDVGQF